MTVRYLTKDEFAKWDHFVLNHPEGHRFQTTEWLSLVTGTEPYVIGFENDAAQLLGGFAFTLNSKAGFKRLLQPPLTPYLFPIGMELYYEELIKKETLFSELLNQTSVVQITPTALQADHQLQDKVSGLLPSKTRTKVNRHPTYILFSEDHPQPDDEYLLKHYKKDCRKQIRRARRDGLSISTSLTPKQAYPLFQLVLSEKGKDVPVTLRQFERLHDALQPDGDLLLGVVDQEGNLHTAAWILCDKKAGYLLLSGLNKSKAHHDAGRLLFHEGIKTSLQSGLNFDFEGSSIPSVAAVNRMYNPSRIELETTSIVNSKLLSWSNPVLESLTGKKLF